MYIRDIYQQKKPVISFEIFPPKQNYSLDTIFSTIEALQTLEPDYISVTYGAGGSRKDRTIEIASIVKNRYQIESLAHLTCVSSTKTEIHAIAKELQQQKIQNILALRGDFPKDPNFKFPNPLHYHYAQDLVKDLTKHYNFSIGGAFYPEGHIEAPSFDEDIRHVSEKVNAGADFLISQIFFDNKYFYHYLDEFKQFNQSVPFSAGIMAVTNAKQISTIAALCGCSIPAQLSRLMAKYDHSPTDLKQAGITYAATQIQDLIDRGVDGIHIYTMNHPEVAKQIMEQVNF